MQELEHCRELPANKQEEVLHCPNLDYGTHPIGYCMDLMYILAQKEISQNELGLI